MFRFDDIEISSSYDGTWEHVRFHEMRDAKGPIAIFYFIRFYDFFFKLEEIFETPKIITI